MYFIRNDGIEDLLFGKKKYVGESLSKIPYSKVKVSVISLTKKQMRVQYRVSHGKVNKVIWL